MDEKLISLEAVRQIYREEVCRVNDIHDLEPFINRIESLPTIKQESKWIPVSERLPEEGESVLLTICANSALYGFNKNWVKVMCGSYSPCGDERDWLVDGVAYYIDNVIAWMPFPEPYKAESEKV